MFPALEPTGCYLGTIDPSKILVSPKSSGRCTFPDYFQHQFLLPQGESQPSLFPRPLLNNRSARKSGRGAYEVTAFALSSGEHETLCSPSWQLLHLLLPIQLTVILYLPKLFFFFFKFIYFSTFSHHLAKGIIITYVVLSTKTCFLHFIKLLCTFRVFFFTEGQKVTVQLKICSNNFHWKLK